MDTFSAVSETALMTLKARVVESTKKKPILQDPIAVECFSRLQSMLPIEIRKRILDRDLPLTLTRYIALRARKYDRSTKQFLSQYHDGLVVSLGCGFDTRYWRISKEPWKYVEVDLPNVVEAKKKVLGDMVTYRMMGCSVLEEDWIDWIISMQQEHVLFLAEGLLMYLPKDSVINLFKRLATSFTESEIMFEVVTEKYTKGIRKKLVESKLNARGTRAGSSYDYGIRSGKDIESYSDKLKVVEEWSYFEDQDVEPQIFRLLRNIKMFSRGQWTVRAIIN